MDAPADTTPAELRDRRRRLGISQQSLAAAAACSISLVRLLERGYRPLHSPSRDRIERVLDELEAQDRAA
jgi:predicted transcriptional regulator